MRDYRKYAMAMSPIEEKDLILFNISAEEKAHVVKQFNRALINSQKDGSDVAQIILKSLISQFPQWGDAALLFGICLAAEGHYARAYSALEYAVSNSLRSEAYLMMAKDAMKAVKEDSEKPQPRAEGGRPGKNWTSVVSENGGTNERVGMHAPILVKASAKPDKMGMASDRERRDIMMRSASGGDEMAGDDIDIENVRTPADNLRLVIKIAAGVILAALVFVLVRFLILPAVAKVRNSSDTENRLDYLIGALQERSSDPEVAEILTEYGQRFSGSGTEASQTTASAAAVTVEETEGEGTADTEDTEMTTVDTLSPDEAAEAAETAGEEAGPETASETQEEQNSPEEPGETEEVTE